MSLERFVRWESRDMRFNPKLFLAAKTEIDATRQQLSVRTVSSVWEDGGGADPLNLLSTPTRRSGLACDNNMAAVFHPPKMPSSQTL